MTSGHSGRVLNAAATLTRLGGSRMTSATTAAMAEAARAYVDLPAAALRAGVHLARLTGNEAALVTAGASAAISLATASLVTGPEPDALEVFPQLEGFVRTEMIMVAGQRNDYDYGVRLTGVTIVECDASVAGLEAVIGQRTCGVLWFAGTQHPAPGLTIAEIIEVAHRHGVPVVVDAAAQIPPVASLWSYTVGLGADAVIISGGKGLRGPQTTGLLLGRAAVVDGARAHASPHQGIGRAMKVGKEELAGVVAAVEQALAADEDAILASYEETVRRWVDALGALDSVEVRAVAPSEAGQPHSRAYVRILGGDLDATTVADRLWDQDPRVAVLTVADDTIALNPQTVSEDEVDLVIDAVASVLDSAFGLQERPTNWLG